MRFSELDIRRDDKILFRYDWSNIARDGYVNEVTDTDEGEYVQISGQWHRSDMLVILKHWKYNGL